ncbi:hypothetical protein HHI36_000956 [Cryptolaemus montrouzieri]|uniref:Uncharacterized protein n=1 Tax=Cryptolaemus montrouzieri TaxID=559131 RepID=A0ABD2P6H7_9CUCU
MKTRALFYSIIFCTIVFIKADDTKPESKDNIWDALIAEDSNNEVLFERAPGYNRPLGVYGAPAPVYGAPPPPYPIASSSNIGFSLGAGGSFTPNGVLRPHVEILKLVENLVRLKGELVSRAYAVIVDNWELIRSVTATLINNLGTLQAFTLNGIIVLRKIIEFALRLFGSWQVTVPTVNLDFSSLLRETPFSNVM